MTGAIKLLPKGIQSFQKIRGNYIYVDKTKQIYDIISQGSYYFLSRPRRFGKSLLISTLKELFSGNKELFKGLWIEQSDYDWCTYTVIQLNLSALATTSGQALYNDLVWKIEEIARSYSIDVNQAPSLQTKFTSLVEQLAKINKIVILVDEYDYPIINNIAKSDVALECRNILRDFFGVIKDLDAHIHFVFITGVSKFSKTSIFSGLNNLEDITLYPQADTLLGYTFEEVSTYFNFYIKKIAVQKKKTSVEILSELKHWYNGYQFSEEQQHKIYNPYSVLLFLGSGRFLNYWFETGTPSFLLNLIKNKQFSVTQLDFIELGFNELGTIEIEDIPIATLLFQTGYLTIKSYNSETENYKLGFPNFEVESSFLKHLLKLFSRVDLSTINEFSVKLKKSLEHNNVDLFCRLLQTFFADIPSGIQIPHLEKYYQTILFILAKVLNLSVNVEVMTNIGRIDMTIETLTHIFIFEFKVQGSAQEALQQIEEKNYHQKYLMNNKEIVLVGVKFDMKKRNLYEWLIKEVIQ
ncbi:ATP-binding protein [Candidatus Dependentiae bacterium]|nr:ATP-binding protein [Candidatus Dependentiae bacterium]